MLEDRFGPLLDLALRVRHQEQRQRGPKVYSHAPEVECLGKGKTNEPYEFSSAAKSPSRCRSPRPRAGSSCCTPKRLHRNPTTATRSMDSFGSAIAEPVIGHFKDDHRMRRNPLKGRDGDRINAVLAAAGYNFSLLLRWFEELLRALSWSSGAHPGCRFA